MIQKREKFNEDERKLADIAKALSHPARIRILRILNNMNICMTGDIVNQLPLAQSTVSQHLSELKKSGLIHGEIEGPKVCYCINNETMQKAKNIFTQLFNDVCDCK